MLAVDLGVAASLGVLWRGRRTRQRALRRSGLVVQRRRGLGGVEGTARRRLGVASALPARRPVRVLAKDGNGVELRLASSGVNERVTSPSFE